MPTCFLCTCREDLDCMATRRGLQRPRKHVGSPMIRSVHLKLSRLFGAKLGRFRESSVFLWQQSSMAAIRAIIWEERRLPRLSSACIILFFFMIEGEGEVPIPLPNTPTPSASYSGFTLLFCLLQATGSAQESTEVSMGQSRKGFVELTVFFFFIREGGLDCLAQFKSDFTSDCRCAN